MTPTVLVRTALTADEWAIIRKLAIDAKQPVSKFVANTLRDALLKGAEPR